MKFDYDRDTALVERWSKLADAKDADLSKFRKSGGKLIMTYGWADQILQPMMGVNYYEAVVAKNGTDTPDFARLFMMPGVAHCGGGVGPDRNDAVTAVIDWVEKGKAPDTLIASKVTNGRSCARVRSARIRRSRATRGRAASTTRRTSAASRLDEFVAARDDLNAHAFDDRPVWDADRDWCRLEMFRPGCQKEL